MPNKSRAQLEAENQILRRTHISSNISKVLIVLIVVSGFAFGLDRIKDIAVAWAGKKTEASIDINSDIKGQASLSYEATTQNTNHENNDHTTLCFVVAITGWIFGIGGIYLARQQAKLRRKTVAHLSSAKEMAEKAIDPNRSSSGLLKTGESRPEDK